TWQSGPISDPRLIWGAKRGGHFHHCTTCGIILLTGKKKLGFCCGPEGSKFNDVQPLPPLPPEFDAFLTDLRLSHLSRILNLMISFSLKTTQPFPQIDGPPGFMAIQGCIYHR
ncbi:hypothetical protein DFH08DRAFT_673787, partial [Mycena albidolilacea]